MTSMVEIWERVKRRDGSTCQLCFKEIELPARGSLDHILPHSMGGEISVENLSLTHSRCNGARGSELIPERDKLRYD